MLINKQGRTPIVWRIKKIINYNYFFHLTRRLRVDISERLTRLSAWINPNKNPHELWNKAANDVIATSPEGVRRLLEERYTKNSGRDVFLYPEWDAPKTTAGKVVQAERDAKFYKYQLATETERKAV